MLHYEVAQLGIESVIVQPGGYGTSFFANMTQASDTDRIQTYGEMAKAPEQMFAGFGEMLSSDDAPDPKDVAKGILKLIETPAGKKPLRTVVDAMAAEAVEGINTAAAKGQEQIMKIFQG